MKSSVQSIITRTDEYFNLKDDGIVLSMISRAGNGFKDFSSHASKEIQVAKYLEKVLSDIPNLSAISEVNRPNLSRSRTSSNWSTNSNDPLDFLCLSVVWHVLEPTQYLILSAFGLTKLKEKGDFTAKQKPAMQIY